MPPTSAQLDAVRQLVRESVAAVDALTPSALQAVLPALRAARDEMRRDLRDWLAKVENGGDRFTAFQRTRALRSLEAVFERIAELKPAMAGALAKTRMTTGPLAITNLDTEIQRLSAIFGGGIPSIPQIKTAAIIAKGNKLLWKRHETSAARYAGAVGEDIRKQFAIGVAKGETFEQLVNRLRRLGNPAAKAGPIDPGADAGWIADGLFRRHRWWAERLVRTESMNAYNVEHDAAIEYANDNRPEGDEEFLRRWDASVDPRTCVLCMELDGTVTTIGGTFKGGIANPPRHPCCRCVVLAWLRRWGDLKGEIPARGPMPPIKGGEPEPLPPAPVFSPDVIPQIPAAGQAIMAPLERGDYREAVHRIDRALRDRGLSPSSTPNTGAIDVSDDGMVTRNHSGDVISARAFRRWDGSMRLSTQVDQEIRKYTAVAKNLHPERLRQALEEHTVAIDEYRMNMSRKAGSISRWRKLRATLPTGDEERQSINAISKYNAAGIKTVIHEALHGFSPLEAGAYRGAAGQIEEITTEVMARVVSRDLFGMPIISHLEGSYAYDIEAATDAIAELTGKSHQDAYADLQRASERFKRRRATMFSAADVSGAWAEDIAHVTGTTPIRAEVAMDKHLTLAASRTSALAAVRP